MLVGSLAFWLGNAETAAGQLHNAFINFSTYPNRIFKGGARLLLLVILPAGFIAGVPVELLRAPSLVLVLQEAAAALIFSMAAAWVFRAGLRRYTSGNLLALRE